MQSASLQTFHWGISKRLPKSAYGRSGGALLLQPQLDVNPAAGIRLHPDESGWLFLGGSVATGARFRFTSGRKLHSGFRYAVASFIWIDLACLKNAASSCRQA